MGVAYSQLFPPSPSFKEDALPNLQSKVYIVTGGASGIGAELVNILYKAGAKVYIAGRSEEAAQVLISKIQGVTLQSTQSSTERPIGPPGELFFLYLDLADLTTIKPAARKFLGAENTLDVLFNNAAVSLPPAGSKSAQGHELMMATNVLGPHLFTNLLLPALKKTANARIVWTTSQNAELGAPKGGFTMDRIRNPNQDQVYNYNASKIGNWLLCNEYARSSTITNVTANPGNVKSNLLRHMPQWQRFLASPLLHSVRQGAYTELYAGLSPDVQNGGYVIPWGRKHPAPREDFLAAVKTEEEGGTGLSLEFRLWCDEQIEVFL